MIRSLLLSAILAFVMVSCSQENGVVSEKKMEAVLYDIHMADGTINIYRYTLNKYMNVDSVYAYKSIFEKNHITRDEFVNSLQYYSKYPKKMDKIYTTVVNKLSAYQQKLNDEYMTGEKGKKGGKGKSADSLGRRPGPPGPRGSASRPSMPIQ